MNLTPMNNETNDTSCASLLYRPRTVCCMRALSVARVRMRMAAPTYRDPSHCGKRNTRMNARTRTEYKRVRLLWWTVVSLISRGFQQSAPGALSQAVHGPFINAETY